MNLKRIMIAAPSSGSGKTLLTCGLLGLLKKKGYKVGSFKCGPDFIDPMFHSKVLGTKSRNLDTYFTDPDTTRMLLAKNSHDLDIAVMEGVMGYYDGMGLNSSKAGASDLADVTDTPVLLIVNGKGASRSILPAIKGFLDFQTKPCIKGVVLNRINGMLYPKLKEMIETELGVAVVGYLPVLTDCLLESRHLGLMMPDEIESIHEKLDKLADVLSETLELESILELASNAPELVYTEEEPVEKVSKPVRIGLARDEAFCFFYEDNLTLLREMGVELVEFSPIHDKGLPENLQGLLLHGGYPELYAKALSENETMRASIRRSIAGGMPTMAECGGFLYLHDSLKTIEGEEYPMVGAVPGKAYYTGKLTRFGYIGLQNGSCFGLPTEEIRSHEFHYFDSENNGDAYLAQKPMGKRNWSCIHSEGNLFTGFPHLYYYANKQVPKAFVKACEAYEA